MAGALRYNSPVAKLHQFNFSYQTDEDRLLLRVNTHEGSEIRLWLTRRVARLLWELLVRRLETAPEVAAQASPQAKRSVVAFKRQAAVSNANFKKTYENKPKELPLGEAPLLIVKLKAATVTPGTHALTFVPKSGKEVSLTMSEEAILTFLHLFGQIVKKARWGLAFDLDDRSTPAQGSHQIM
ncbi:MAG: hypothetical protein RID42_01575 [Alphaproteobacteria bacterium]